MVSLTMGNLMILIWILKTIHFLLISNSLQVVILFDVHTLSWAKDKGLFLFLSPMNASVCRWRFICGDMISRTKSISCFLEHSSPCWTTLQWKCLLLWLLFLVASLSTFQDPLVVRLPLFFILHQTSPSLSGLSILPFHCHSGAVGHMEVVSQNHMHGCLYDWCCHTWCFQSIGMTFPVWR